MLPILMVVAVIPWVLSAPAGPTSQPSATRPRTSATTRRAVFMVSSTARCVGAPEPPRASPAERPGQAGPDRGPGGVDVGDRRGPLGRDRLDPVVDLVLAPVAHRGGHRIQELHRRVLERRGPALLDLR